MKGFTLVEMIAVIVIISVISLIIIPMVSGVISDSKTDSYDAQVASIVSKVKLYMSEFPEEIVFTSDQAFVDLQDLIDKGYIDGPVKNPITSKDFCNNTGIEIIRSGNSFTYNDSLGEC